MDHRSVFDWHSLFIAVEPQNTNILALFSQGYDLDEC